MGMDLIEMVMEIEDEFDLSIPDSAATEMTTIGQTIDFVVAALRHWGGDVGVCATARSFYRLRASLASRCGTPRRLVRLESTVGSLVPAPLRGEWSKIAADAGVRARRRPLFSRRLPEAESSVRDVLTNQRRRSYHRSDGSVDDVAVAHSVMGIVSKFTATPAERLTRELRFVDDLLLD